jgi:hypothetical protein
VTPQEFCVGDLKHRTNNWLEGYNSKVKKRISRHPNIYTFLRALQRLVLEDYNKLLYDSNPRNKFSLRIKAN